MAYKPQPKSKSFTFRPGADLESKLDSLAEAAGVTKGECLRNLIRDAVPLRSLTGKTATDIFALGLKLAIEQRDGE